MFANHHICVVLRSTIHDIGGSIYPNLMHKSKYTLKSAKECAPYVITLLSLAPSLNWNMIQNMHHKDTCYGQCAQNI